MSIKSIATIEKDKTRKEYLTFCFMCAVKCSRKLIVENGKVIGVDRDLESGLPTEWCPSARGQHAPEIYNHPERLKYPMKRSGARGEGKLQRITWDEALDTIAAKLKEVKEKYGPEYVALMLGEPKGMEVFFGYRFATMFGTPNVATPGHVCVQSAVMGSNYTFGGFFRYDEMVNPKLIVLWGNDPIETVVNGTRREQFRSALLEGAKLIVIDPKKIDIAGRADLWIRPRPSSDGALAMGVLKVMIEEKLYDEKFVADFCIGFEKIQEQVKTYSLSDVEKTTWVPPEQIRKFARMYWDISPATIEEGDGISHSINCFQTSRAINIIRAISGKINMPGGDILYRDPPTTKLGRFVYPKDIPVSRKMSRVIGAEYKLAIRGSYIPTESLINSLLTGEPYVPKAALFMLTNPLLSIGNSKKTYDALMKLEFFAGSDIFPTPTTQIADIVLPAAWGAEQETLDLHFVGGGRIQALPKIVEPPGEARPDPRWINELAGRLGLPGFWDDEKKALELMVQPSGITWDEFKKKRILHGGRETKTPQEGLFKTPSGKAELYSQQLADLGYSPLPVFPEVSHYRYEVSEEYPLLMTNAKEPQYYLSGYKHVKGLRAKTPYPLVEVHPDTAAESGVKEGDWIYIETKNGRIQQQLVLNPDLDPRVILAAFGWWFPEEPDNLYKFMKSNINVLTDNDSPRDPQLGTPEFRGIPCRIRKVQH